MHASPVLLAATAALVFSASCKSSLPVTADPSAQRVPVTRLSPGPASLTYNSGLREPQRTVVRDEAAWRALWSAIWRGTSPEPALPPIDFAREMVVVAALGERNTGGYGILIDSATTTSGGPLVVWIRSIRPGPGCMTTQALTQPVDAARLPRSEAAVEFREQPAVADCGR